MPFWEDLEAHGRARPSFSTLDTDLGGLDCVVIGAGIVGLKLSRHLAQYNLTCAILEGSTIGDQAASARNQGCLQRTADNYLSYGANARLMEELGLENRRMIRQQIDEYAIDCDLLDTPECSLVCADSPGAEATLVAMREEVAARQADGFACRYLDPAGAAEMGAAGRVNGLYKGE
jgi:glycine/D-amino acid oxidase-like deaminating enzyme